MRMFQVPLPSIEVDSLQVPLPDAVERWRDLYVTALSQKVIAFVAVAVLLYFLARFARRLVSAHIEEVNRRHTLRKWVTYAYVAALFLFGVALFAESLVGLGAVLALLVAGIAVALQDILKSVVGWIYISSRSGVSVGSRIEVKGVIGDVIDIGVLKTTVMEVGGTLIFGRQSTGRLVTIPNSQLLSEPVLITSASSPFVWQEVRITVTFESDWPRAEEILREVADEIHAENAPNLRKGFSRLEDRYAFKYGTLTPIVYVTLGSNGVDLTLRYLIHVRRRRGSVDRVSRRVLTAFAASPGIRLAYATYRAVRLEEYGPGGFGEIHGAEGRMQGEDPGVPPPDLLTE